MKSGNSDTKSGWMDENSDMKSGNSDMKSGWMERWK